MKLPSNICAKLWHNPHVAIFQPVAEWLEHNTFGKEAFITPEDREQILATNEIWVLGWCPSRPLLSFIVAAPTLERVLQLAEEATAPSQAKQDQNKETQDGRRSLRSRP